MVDAALNFTRFFRNESCGKCVPCRVGSQQMVNLIKLLRGGVDESTAQRIPGDMGRLEDVMAKGSICGLGQVVAVPIQTVMKHWPQEVEEHLLRGRCAVNVCPPKGSNAE
jgi:NADH:ubiquinone oxidoreductase subunit F (NADH-binding)